MSKIFKPRRQRLADRRVFSRHRRRRHRGIVIINRHVSQKWVVRRKKERLEGHDSEEPRSRLLFELLDELFRASPRHCVRTAERLRGQKRSERTGGPEFLTRKMEREGKVLDPYESAESKDPSKGLSFPRQGSTMNLCAHVQGF
ncbi:hypothetical protein KM043_002037 [Ampulex compressa]|nr:hypothetical protein KM043_002037 [Ampulex compressa]